MRTHASFRSLGLGLGLLTSTLVLAAGCGQDESLDLSDVPVASEEGKADVYFPGGNLFRWVRPSGARISCVRAPCPNALLNEVNLSSVEMSYAYDWRALKLSASDQANLEANIGKMLLYGKYASARMSGEVVQIYQVTRANPRVSDQSWDSVDTDRYYAVKATNPSCRQPPCGYSAVLMNRQQSEQWTDVELSRLALSQNARQILTGELQKGSAYLSIQSASVMPVVATEAFRPYSAAPLPQN